jgi:hypothetical protein
LLETSIGAVSRVKTFTTEIRPENLSSETFVPPENWPMRGQIEFRNVSASYKYVSPAPIAVRIITDRF